MSERTMLLEGILTETQGQLALWVEALSSLAEKQNEETNCRLIWAVVNSMTLWNKNIKEERG